MLLRYVSSLAVIALLSVTTVFCQTAQKWAEQGDKLYEARKYVEAIEAYSKAVKLNPKNNVYAHQIAVCYYDNSKYDSAIVWYNKSIELQPDYYFSYVGRGNSYSAQKKYKLALIDLSTAIELSMQSDANSYYWRSRTYATLQDFDAALRDINKAIQVNPADLWYYHARAYTLYEFCASKAEIGMLDPTSDLLKQAYADITKCIEGNIYINLSYARRGLILYLMEKYNASIDDYTKSIELQKTYSGAWFGRACVYEKLGNISHAYTDYTEAIHYDSCYTTAYGNRGSISLDSGNIENARSDFQKALNCNPNSADDLYNFGYLYLLQGLYKDGIDAMTKVIELNSCHSKALCVRGRAYMNTAHRKSRTYQDVIDTTIAMLALRDYTAAKSCPTKVSAAYTDRAKLLNLFERYEEAMADCDEAVKLFPATATVYYQKGHTLFLMRKKIESLKCYLEALKFDPKYAAAYNNIGNCIEELLGDPIASSSIVEVQKLLLPDNPAINHDVLLDHAEHYYSTAIKHNSKSAIAYQSLGSLHYKRNKYSSAVEHLSKSIELESNDPVTYLYRGRAYAKLGKKVEAKKDLNRYLNETPSTDKEAIKVREEFEDLLED